MKWLTKIFGWLKFFTSDKVINTVDRITREAIPIVATIAKFTPTRADDAIVNLCMTYGLPALDWYKSVPEEERGVVLSDIAARILEKRFPTAPWNLIKLAVETAVASFRRETETP